MGMQTRTNAVITLESDNYRVSAVLLMSIYVFTLRVIKIVVSLNQEECKRRLPQDTFVKASMDVRSRTRPQLPSPVVRHKLQGKIVYSSRFVHVSLQEANYRRPAQRLSQRRVSFGTPRTCILLPNLLKIWVQQKPDTNK